ncbi:hypothetical protein PFMG_04934 [Plasmodium falciparum IGH-CR14]|nr:hypothetical protein PFMG_04934 [Plasmodium falciparum IGH-CR14]
MENSIRHSVDIKSEDFVVIIALQNLQTFIMIGYTAVNKIHLTFDVEYLWALCLGTLLFIYSLISFVVIRTFVLSKIDIGKYVLEILFFISIIVTCTLSLIIDSFKIANMQLLFFSFALTGYAYYNLITLFFFSVAAGILIQYNLNIGSFGADIDALFFIDLLSYILQIIGGNILYFRVYELCCLLVISKKNPCKYVVASKKVKNLEKQIFSSLINSYICFKSKTYSHLPYPNDSKNNNNASIVTYEKKKKNSVLHHEYSHENKNSHFSSDINTTTHHNINNKNKAYLNSKCTTHYNLSLNNSKINSYNSGEKILTHNIVKKKINQKEKEKNEYFHLASSKKKKKNKTKINKISNIVQKKKSNTVNMNIPENNYFIFPINEDNYNRIRTACDISTLKYNDDKNGNEYNISQRKKNESHVVINIANNDNNNNNNNDDDNNNNDDNDNNNNNNNDDDYSCSSSNSIYCNKNEYTSDNINHFNSSK